MRSFFVEQRSLMVMLLVMALWLVLFPRWVRRVTANPLDVTISLAPKGAVSTDVRIVIPEQYQLNLVFARMNVPTAQLETLLGTWTIKDGKPLPSGVKVPIRWALISAQDGATAASGEVDSFGATGWSATEVVRPVGQIRVPPGQYHFTAEVLRDVPELAQLKTHLTIQLESKTSTTWQVTAAWWGSIVSYYLILPAAIGIVLLLLWRAVMIRRG